MADKIVKIYGDARFLLRHGTLENWQTKNPILLEAEPSYVIDGEDGKKIKFGDGVTPWNDLPYLSSNINNGGDITVDQTYAPTSENAQSGKAVAEAVSDKQDSLVSGTNIKTINNQSILGSGNITIEDGSDVEVDQIYSPTSENAQSGKAVAEAIALIEVDLTNYYTKSEVDDALARVTPTIKTVMDEVAVAGTQYYLGEVTELNITLPEDAEIGQEITVSWYNGETASTLAIDGNMLDFDYIPEANTRSEINALWDGTYWSVIGMSQEVPIEVTV